MNILVLGSGGREHALSWKISQSPLCSNLYVAPGNAGTEAIAANIELNVMDFESIKSFCVEFKIDLVVVGPDDPLAAGIVDFFYNNIELQKVNIFGPTKDAAMLESSKAFAKKFMQKYNIPTASYKEFSFSELDYALRYVEQHSLPIVIKADGLALGKGVVICNSHDEAKHEVKSMLEGKFGEASNKIVIEEFLNGIELSCFVITNGTQWAMMPEAKDYKRIGENNTGLNTGGMGSISPVNFFNNELQQKVINKIIQPTIDGIKSEKLTYIGFVFFGLIIVNNEPWVIEYNARLGDPETQVILPRLQADLLSLIDDCFSKKLNNNILQSLSSTYANVVLCSKGYPEKYEKNKKVFIPTIDNSNKIFHMGTKNDKGDTYTNGGRVLSAVGIGDDIKNALSNAYKLAHEIDFENKHFRSDIGKDISEILSL